MYEFENEKNMNSVIRIHRFGNADMCICLCQDTGAMNPPLRLWGVLQPISWVGVGILWTVRNDFWVLERVGLLYEVHLELA